MITITSWGKSMYGGWYINYIENNDTRTANGKHFRTINELRAYIKSLGLKLDAVHRLDN